MAVGQRQLMQRHRVYERLHHRVEEAGVATVTHAEGDLFVLEENTLALHQISDGLVLHGVDAAGKRRFIRLSLGPLGLDPLSISLGDAWRAHHLLTTALEAW